MQHWFFSAELMWWVKIFWLGNLETKKFGGAYGTPHMGGLSKIRLNKYLWKVNLLECVSSDSRARRGEYVTEYTCGFIGDGGWREA